MISLFKKDFVPKYVQVGTTMILRVLILKQSKLIRVTQILLGTLGRNSIQKFLFSSLKQCVELRL